MQCFLQNIAKLSPLPSPPTYGFKLTLNRGMRPFGTGRSDLTKSRTASCPNSWYAHATAEWLAQTGYDAALR